MARKTAADIRREADDLYDKKSAAFDAKLKLLQREVNSRQMLLNSMRGMEYFFNIRIQCNPNSVEDEKQLEDLKAQGKSEQVFLTQLREEMTRTEGEKEVARKGFLHSQEGVLKAIEREGLEALG
jgi:hypothetical protein